MDVWSGLGFQPRSYPVTSPPARTPKEDETSTSGSGVTEDLLRSTPNRPVPTLSFPGSPTL